MFFVKLFQSSNAEQKNDRNSDLAGLKLKKREIYEKIALSIRPNNMTTPAPGLEPDQTKTEYIDRTRPNFF